ncbi:amino acid transporter [Curtobacterium flaccumfaciens]|uniref:Amino acid transporter n=1 Tax=Curtobacterium salicis TaxID=1779862 RepID=A0ABX0TB45_9MICO|nr:hypothetical protein [Curtobacterium sp. WW7]NII42128.1 amino acid transporter [Curtobacterium sp. WW7]
MDLDGTAAIGGVVLAAISAAASGIVGRGRMRRMERLVDVMTKLEKDSDEQKIVLGMVLDHARSMDYRQRGPRSGFQVVVAWIAQAIGWLCAFVGYISLYLLLVPVLFPEPSKDGSESNPWYNIIVLALLALLFILGGVWVRNGTKKTRGDWIVQHSPEATTP